MKKVLICLAIAILIIVIIIVGINHIKLYSSVEHEYGDLPIVRIDTQNGKHPEDKENSINCSFEILNCKDPSHDFKVEMKESFDSKEADGGVGIRLRGNTTMAYEKKPYRIKFKEEFTIMIQL